ncbi:MAG: hypothetical protein KAH08_05865 [Methylococcales bacterium]|nr:hypothetical protein [Methylococcales bacterium]
MGANLQGATLWRANLEGVYSNHNDNKFSSQKGKPADIAGISTEVLTTEKVEIIMAELQAFIFDEYPLLETIRTRLEKAVGKDPIEWVKNQQGIKLGVLSEADYDKIDKSVTNPKARQRMGFPPLADD